jgi:microcystin-dependent protein
MGGFLFGESEMFKRCFLALALAAGLLGPAHAAGTIPFSLSQQLDQYGKPLAGCLFYTIQAGTTSTPQNAYQDSALTIPLPNPQTCDAAGRLPQMFLADGTIKVRLTDKNGVQVLVADNIQVVGASSGSGGGGTVDATTILATGDLKVKYGTGTLSGFVRANGRTIGSSTSGATERANADTQSLFEYLWGADANLTVSGGRGASANADWTANKTLTLPDLRGRIIAGLDDMGNTAAGRITSSTVTGGGTTLGNVGGAETNTIARANLPNVSPTFSGIASSVGVQSPQATIISNGIFNSNQLTQSGNSFGMTALAPGATSSVLNSAGIFTPQGSVGSLNGGVTQTGMVTLPPVMVASYYIKL